MKTLKRRRCAKIKKGTERETAKRDRKDPEKDKERVRGNQIVIEREREKKGDIEM
jgi:hypothetical protein